MYGVDEKTREIGTEHMVGVNLTARFTRDHPRLLSCTTSAAFP